MNKNDLVKALAEKTDFTQKDVTAVIDAFVCETTKVLLAGEEVAIAGFGKFYTSKTKAQKRVVPNTQRMVEVPSKIVPKFKAGKAFKEAFIKK